VQKAAAAAWDRGVSFREQLAQDETVGAVLNDDELEALFDPAVYVSELDGVFHRLEKLEVAEPELGPELEPGRPT
jgi:adenylosuccinate lyase